MFKKALQVICEHGAHTHAPLGKMREHTLSPSWLERGKVRERQNKREQTGIDLKKRSAGLEKGTSVSFFQKFSYKEVLSPNLSSKYL